MAALRSALRRMAPAAGFVSKGVRGSSGPIVAARRNFFTAAGGFRAFCRESFSLKRPETWFAGMAIVFGGTYRVIVQKGWQEILKKDSDTSRGQQKEEGNARSNPIT